MSESQGVTLPSLSATYPVGDPLDSTSFRRSSSNRKSSCSSGSGEQVRRLQRENARLKEEMDSLKAMFARRIAHDESAFEEKITAKDVDCERWFKSKKQDLKKMQAASVIMKCIFDARRKKFMDDLAEERGKFNSQKSLWQQEMAKIRTQLAENENENKKQLDWWTQQWEAKQQQTEQEKEAVQGHNRLLLEQLNDKKLECEEIRKEANEQSQALEQLRARLLHVERADELLKRNSQIEALEAELKRTKKMIGERQQGEADSLRRELMEYVKFIVHILPEEWQSKVKEQESLRLGAISEGKQILAPTAPGTDSRSRNPRRKQPIQHRASHAVYPSPYLQHGTLGGVDQMFSDR